MCVITNEKHIVVSVSIIPGLGNIPESYHVYFPAKSSTTVGETYREDVPSN